MAPSSPSQQIEKAGRALRGFIKESPALAIILGSGFASILDDLTIEKEIGFATIPGFPSIQVPGHQAKLVLIRVGTTPVLILCGRAHYYEGHSMDTVTFPTRVLAHLGIRHLLLTNAAGGVNPRFKAGDLMLVSDHINFMGANPLRGLPAPQGNPFVDLTSLYEPALRQCLKKAARQQSMTLREGIYLAVSGPSFETPAEIRIFRKWGADAVGMSTVPEAIMARQCGLQVAALSCITNPAAGLSKTPLSHEDVLEVGRRSSQSFTRLIRQFIVEYAKDFSALPHRRGH